MIDTKTDKVLNLSTDLEQFTGTEHWYKHQFGGHYTDGVRYLAQTAGAYWLIDAIFSYRRAERFQVWTLEVKIGRASCRERV